MPTLCSAVETEAQNARLSPHASGMWRHVVWYVGTNIFKKHEGENSGLLSNAGTCLPNYVVSYLTIILALQHVCCHKLKISNRIKIRLLTRQNFHCYSWMSPSGLPNDELAFHKEGTNCTFFVTFWQTSVSICFFQLWRVTELTNIQHSKHQKYIKTWVH